MRTILYVCTGNTCRSPMAEAIARHVVADGSLLGGNEALITSAGVSAFPDMPISVETIRALKDLGIEHNGRSRLLTAEMIQNADVVFCMTGGHREMAAYLVAGHPDQEQKIQQLDPAQDVPDPIGQDQAAYDALATWLMTVIPDRLKEVLVT